jgi:hypothetical protein
MTFPCESELHRLDPEPKTLDLDDTYLLTNM